MKDGDPEKFEGGPQTWRSHVGVQPRTVPENARSKPNIVRQVALREKTIEELPPSFLFLLLIINDLIRRRDNRWLTCSEKSIYCSCSFLQDVQFPHRMHSENRVYILSSIYLFIYFINEIWWINYSYHSPTKPLKLIQIKSKHAHTHTYIFSPRWIESSGEDIQIAMNLKSLGMKICGWNFHAYKTMSSSAITLVPPLNRMPESGLRRWNC